MYRGGLYNYNVGITKKYYYCNCDNILVCLRDVLCRRLTPAKIDLLVATVCDGDLPTWFGRTINWGSTDGVAVVPKHHPDYLPKGRCGVGGLNRHWRALRLWNL